MAKQINNQDIDSLAPVIVKEWETMGCPVWEIDWLLDYRLMRSAAIKDTPFVKDWTKSELQQLVNNEIKGVDFILDKLINKS